MFEQFLSCNITFITRSQYLIGKKTGKLLKKANTSIHFFYSFYISYHKVVEFLNKSFLKFKTTFYISLFL